MFLIILVQAKGITEADVLFTTIYNLLRTFEMCAIVSSSPDNISESRYGSY